MQKKLCELCQLRFGAYSNARRLFICESCWQALGRQEARFDAATQGDLTGQDQERD